MSHIIDNPRDVRNPNYDISNMRNFLGGSDTIRIIINLYILASLILNGINYAVIFITMKKNKIKLVLANWLILGVLFMNFIHTAAYFYEWVITDNTEVGILNVDVDKSESFQPTVGALLFGNPKHMFLCYSQGFFLIFSSISQDFLINIFFYLIDTSVFNSFYVKLAILIIGILFPFVFTSFLMIFGAIGLNDRFCYVKKYRFNDINDDTTEVKYEYNGKTFQICVMIVYFIRIINCIATTYFLVKIIKYVKKEKKPYSYLIKLIFIPSIQVFTIGIGVLYRFINLISMEASVSLAAPYLLLNTSDGFLFPIGFAIQNDIFSQFKNIILGKSNEKRIRETIQEFEFIEKDSQEIDTL